MSGGQWHRDSQSSSSWWQDLVNRWRMERPSLPTSSREGARGRLMWQYVESVSALQLREHSSRLWLQIGKQMYPQHIISQCPELGDWGFPFLILERAGKFKWDFILPGRRLPKEDRAFWLSLNMMGHILNSFRNFELCWWGEKYLQTKKRHKICLLPFQ